jgi:hypothetical protein
VVNSQFEAVFNRLRGVFFNVEHVLRTGFRANPARNTLRRLFSVFRLDHHTEGTSLNTLPATLAKFFVEHKDALGILVDRLFRTCFSAFSALDAGLYLNFPVILCFDMYARQVFPEITLIFVKSLGAGSLTGKTVHTRTGILDRYFLHKNSPLVVVFNNATL